MSEQRKTPMTAPAAANPVRSNDEGTTIDLVDLFYRLLANWKLIVILALVFAVGSGVYTIYFVTPMYSATSIIYVLSPDSILNVSTLQLGNALTTDYVKVFNMWEVHDEVRQNLNLNYSYSKMKSMLSVTNTTNTRMLDITVTSASPKEAADMANEYAKVVSNFIGETMSTDKPNLMSVALEPTNPISPNRVRNIALGFFLGALLACGIVILQFLMDDKFKTAEDIRQYTGMVTLAVVPVEEEEMEGTSKKNRGKRS